MKKILITGGAGFIGSNLGELLLKRGYQVTALDNLFLGRRTNLAPGVKFVKGDVERPADLERAGKNFDYIVHLAAASSSPLFETDLVGSYRNNIIGFVNVLEYGRKIGVKKILFASTSSIYGDNRPPHTEDQPVIPPNFYSVTKLAMEGTARIYADLYGLEIIAFRFMSVYGRHEEHKTRFANLVTQFLWTMYQGQQPVVFGDGKQTRDFTFASDVADAIERGIRARKKSGFTIFNIGSTKCYNLIQLIDRINHALGTDIKPRFIPSPLKWTARAQLGDLKKIRRELGFQPKVSLDEGLKILVKDLPRDPKKLPDVSVIEKILKKKSGSSRK